MAKLKFGTDGVRAVANRDLTPEYAMALGRAVASEVGSGCVLVGADPRRSSPMLAAAVAAGIASAGVDVVDFGCVSTPCLASYSSALGLAAVMISASHNPAADNGLKVFAAGGTKLSDEQQRAVEVAIDASFSGAASEAADGDLDRPIGAGVGRIGHRASPGGEAILAQYETESFPVRDLNGYCESIISTVGGPGSLSGLSIVFDGSNGAASEIGPRVFSALGATVTTMFVEPDGLNINECCGSTHLDPLVEAVRQHASSIGVAVDGDADRCLMVDETGETIDGDQMLAVCALDLARRGSLTNNGVAITVMSTLGLRQALTAAGVDYVETPVGDRHVAEAMAKHGLILGGEQSGHLIFGDVATTGDGVLSAARLLAIIAQGEDTLADVVSAAMRRLPQVMINVRLDSSRAADSSRVDAAVASAESALGESGRVLVRASGTEPLLRVMVEADDEAAAAHWAQVIAAAAEG